MLAFRRSSVLFVLVLSSALAAQQPAPHSTIASEAPNRDSSYIDANGTAHVTRVVPVPETVSPEARQSLARVVPDGGPAESLAERRAHLATSTAQTRALWSKICPVEVVESKMAGVAVHIVTPDPMPETNRDKVLLNLHGGGFNADSGSYTESIPIASYSGIKVVSALYRLAPEDPFPAAVDDAVSVYKELLKTYSPAHIAIYGTSAGAILTAEVASKLKQLGLPLPAALGVFSGMGDFARPGDSASIYALGGFSGHLDPPAPGVRNSEYAGAADPRDPILSPIFSDLHGMPPTLFVTSGRDLLLSGTVNLHRAYLNAGADARLVVYDALPHAFWYNPRLPESIEANHLMAGFFVKQLSR